MSGHRPSSTRSVKGWWNSKLSLGPHDVHLWRARVQDMAQSVAEFSATLSPDEHQRASSFRRAHDREAFVLRRAILRAILSQYLPLGPAEIRFRYGGFGKPYLEPGSHRPELRFNLTHSRGLMLCAVSLGRALGVDIERVEPMAAVDDMAAQFLSDHESRAIAALPPAARLVAFYTCWTRREAYVKATGDGLIGAPVEFPPTGAWRVETVHPAPGYVGAVALKGTDSRISWRDWPADRPGPSAVPRPGRSARARPGRQGVWSGR